MSNSISNSLNMRSLKEAVASQKEHEAEQLELTDNVEIEEYEIEPSYSEMVPVEQPNPMDKAYNDLTDLDQTVFQHDKESNDVIKLAKDAFDTVFVTAQSVPPEKASYLFEVAGQFLEIINKASDSKVSAKHDRAKLSIALTKAQLQAGLVDGNTNTGIKAHRNDILKAIIGDDIQDADFTKENDPEENK